MGRADLSAVTCADPSHDQAPTGTGVSILWPCLTFGGDTVCCYPRRMR